jgi:two-component system sensor histidine kinase CreC
VPLTARITILFLAVFGLGFYIFVRQEVFDTTRRYREATEEPLVDFANVLALTVTREWERGDRSFASLRDVLSRVKEINPSANIFDFKKTSIDLRVYVTNDQGMVLFDSEGGRDEGKDYREWLDVSRTLAGEYGARTSWDTETPTSSTMHVAAPIKFDGRVQGVLTVAKSNATANQFILTAQKNIWSLGLTLLSAGTLVSAVLSLYVSRPLRRLTEYVKEVRDGKRDAAPPRAKGEIGSLTKAFEEMREALEGKKYIERYVQSLTHELKSPVTAIRGAVEVLQDAALTEEQGHFLSNIERETGRILGLAEQLLVLSSIQTHRGLVQREEVTLNDLIDEAFQALQGEFEAERVIVRIDASERVALSGNRFWLREAVKNVMRNAVEFSPEGEVVDISVQRQDGSVVLCVLDRGPGIPDWALEKVTNQFFSLPRPSSQHRSSGLGLSIVKEVMELHGGDLVIGNREGGGASVELRFAAP